MEKQFGVSSCGVGPTAHLDVFTSQLLCFQSHPPKPPKDKMVYRRQGRARVNKPASVFLEHLHISKTDHTQILQFVV